MRLPAFSGTSKGLKKGTFGTFGLWNFWNFLFLDIVFLYKSKSSKSSESSKKFLVTFFNPTQKKSAAIFLTSSFKQLASVCSKMAKRKAPDVKVEPPTPKKKAMAKAKAKASDGSAIPEATPSVASEAAAMDAPSTESKPAKARAVKDGELPAPSKDAWKDMHQQLARKAKAGDTALKTAWDKACANGSQQAKREFYYNTFLLDESAASRSVHKQSLERLKKTDKVIDGWMTKYQIAKLQGADPQDPDFNKLAEAAVLGLPERPHEVKAWAELGHKQYKLEKQLATEKERSYESTTAAHQEVKDLQAPEFQQVEKALMAVPESSQVTLGGKPKPDRPLPKPEMDEVETTMEEQYKATYKSLKKAVTSLGTAVDKLLLLKEACKKAQLTANSSQLDASIQELDGLEQTYSKSKTAWLERLGQWKENLDEPEKGKEHIEAMASMKKEADDDYKSLQKAVGPHRLWAKNANII